MGREDLRTVGLIVFAAATALGIYVLAEGLSYSNPDVGDPLSNIITIVGIAVTLIAIGGAATVLLAFGAVDE